MGGVDITNTVYSNGSITIPNVTGNIVITATATTQYSGKTFRATGQNSADKYHCTALIKYDSSFKGKVVSRSMNISNIESLTNFSTSGGGIFMDKSGKLTNSLYIKDIKGTTTNFHLTVDGTNGTLSCNDKTIPSSLDDTNCAYLKIPFLFNASTPFSFTIQDISIKIEGVEQPILGLGGFFKEETFTLE